MQTTSLLEVGIYSSGRRNIRKVNMNQLFKYHFLDCIKNQHYKTLVICNYFMFKIYQFSGKQSGVQLLYNRRCNLRKPYFHHVRRKRHVICLLYLNLCEIVHLTTELGYKSGALLKQCVAER